MERWCAVAPPGLEAVVARELATLGVETVVEPGLVRFFATREAGAQLAYRCRTPARLLVELASAPECREEVRVSSVGMCLRLDTPKGVAAWQERVTANRSQLALMRAGMQLIASYDRGVPPTAFDAIRNGTPILEGIADAGDWGGEPVEEVGHAADGVAGGFADFDADGTEGEDVAGGDWVGVFEEFAVADEDLGVGEGIAEGWECGDVVRVGVGDEDEGGGEPVGGDGVDDGGGVSSGVDDGGVFAGWVEDDGGVDGHVVPCGVEDEEPVEGEGVGVGGGRNMLNGLL
jgi:hypothetical protein